MVLAGVPAANAQDAQTNEAGQARSRDAAAAPGDGCRRRKGRHRYAAGGHRHRSGRHRPSDSPTTIGDIIRAIPGVNVTGSDRLLGQSFNIRGIGAPETTGDGGRIIVNVDGVQKFYEQYRLGSFFSDPELYKRVEVLRGPASSTLYGSGALGGVINFETKDASDFIADGQNGAVRLKAPGRATATAYLLSSVLAQRWGENAEFLLTGNYRGSDPYESGNGNEVLGTNFLAWSGLAKGTFKVGDEGTLRLSYQQWDSDLDDQHLSQTATAAFFGLVDRHIVDKTAIASYENPFSDSDMLDVKLTGILFQHLQRATQRRHAAVLRHRQHGGRLQFELRLRDLAVQRAEHDGMGRRQLGEPPHLRVRSRHTRRASAKPSSTTARNSRSRSILKAPISRPACSRRTNSSGTTA